MSMTDLSVEVRGLEITVTKPETGHTVTYRKEPDAPLLAAIDPMRDDPDKDGARFLARAWKAAYGRAKALGWLKTFKRRQLLADAYCCLFPRRA